MENNENNAAAVRIAPPLVYLGGVIAGVLLNAFAVPLGLGIGPQARIAATAAAALLGLVFMYGAIGLFRRTGQDPKPWEPTPEIITTGVYRFSRNPMYVGMGLVQVAIGVGLANWWVIILLPVVLAIVYATAIRHEETYLERKFGDEYTRYKASVRRWV